MHRYNCSGADVFRRMFNIGSNKATAYVELLEDLGYLGPQNHRAGREIPKSWDVRIEQLKGNGVRWTRRTSSTTIRWSRGKRSCQLGGTFWKIDSMLI